MQCTDEALELDDRDLHTFATNRIKNLWQASSIDEFKCIFLDCLECHFHAYDTGKVLHDDISENNLMICHPGDTDRYTNQAATGPSRGILNDFDMAAELGPDGKLQLAAGARHHIAGTLPFMARDLLHQIEWAQIEEAAAKEDKSKNKVKNHPSPNSICTATT